jgi:hypothetical protein
MEGARDQVIKGGMAKREGMRTSGRVHCSTGTHTSTPTPTSMNKQYRKKDVHLPTKLIIRIKLDTFTIRALWRPPLP